MNKDKIIKDLKERNEKLTNQYRLRDIRCVHLERENQELKRQLEYLRSGEYLNQLKFERNMLEDIVQNGGVSKEDKEFIDMTHRNTELLEQINKAIEYMNGEEFFMKMNSNSIQPPADKYVCQDYFEAKNKLVNILGGDIDDE